MIVPVMAISNLVLTQQIYSEETNGAHAHYREPVPLIRHVKCKRYIICRLIRHVKYIRILFRHVKCMCYFNSPCKMYGLF